MKILALSLWGRNVSCHILTVNYMVEESTDQGTDTNDLIYLEGMAGSPDSPYLKLFWHFVSERVLN